MIFNQTLRGFLRKEFSQVLRDPRMRILLFVAPLMQLTLFGLALSSDVKNIRLATMGSPSDVELQHVYERSLSSGWFKAAQSRPGTSAVDLLQSGDADVVLVPPPGGLTQSVQRHQGQLQVLVNASNVLRAQSVEQYIKNIVREVIADDHLVDHPALAPMTFEVRILYNPSMRTAVFMVPGVMSMLMCLITILLTSMSISKEKEVGTFEMLISAPVTTSEVILGKTVPYVVLGLSNIPLILGLAVFAFGVPMQGSLLVLVLAAFVFVCATVSMGTLISTLTSNQQQSMMGGFLFLFPAIQLSGMMFPLENMPTFMKIIAYLNPLTYFLELLRCIMLKGNEWPVIWSHLAVLGIMAAGLVYLSFKRFRTTLG